MISKAHVARHPIHPMLVPIPIGLWIFSLVCDFIFHGTGNTVWSSIALYSMAGGVIGALLAAVPGLFDLYSMEHSKTKTIGLWHMGINLSLVTMYVLNFLWRGNVGPDPVGPVVLSVVAVIFLLVSGWLGGEMVYAHGVGVASMDESQAHKEVPGDREDTLGLRLHHRH